MKKVAFLVLPEKGHINPYIGPAQALKELGFGVSVASIGDISRQIQDAGLDFDPSLLSDQPPLQPMRGPELVKLVGDKHAMKNWIQALLLGVSADDVRKHVDWIQRVQPDVLVIDPLAYAAVIAAEVTRVRWVSMSNSLNPVLDNDVTSDLLETLNDISDRRQQLFQGYGVNVQFRGCDALSKHLTLAFCTPDFVGPSFSDVAMVGPSLPLGQRGDEGPLHIQDPRPIIYTSFGSQIFHWPEIFQNLIAATRGQGLHLVLSVGDLIDTLPREDHVTLFRYAPQLQILPQASVFITHGGANSVMEAIRCKTKMWVSPMCNDQFHQGHYVKKANLGWVEDIRILSVDAIRSRLHQIRSDSAIRENLDRVGQSYQVDGSRKSASLIAELL